MTPLQRQEPVVADKPAHSRHWQADTRSGRRYCLERPLCEAQLTKRCDWASPLLERLLPYNQVRRYAHTEIFKPTKESIHGT
jgi:hypothetical protein